MTPPFTQPSGPIIVAHRGASYDAPENTLGAFQLAWEQGADAIEGDFRLTADGALVCVHDPDFRRTGGVARAVAEMTLAEVRSLDVGGWKGATFCREPVPTLSEVLSVVPTGKRMLIELKCGVEAVPVLSEAIRDARVDADQLAVICFDAEVIASVKRAMPTIAAYWLTDFKRDARGIPGPTAAEAVATVRAIGGNGLDASADATVIDEAFAGVTAASGLELHVWTVDEPALARRFAGLGVASITTNRPAFIREALGR